ncbi:MAG: amino acid permease [Rhodanobacteraceae bacterium]|nr:MAG: amino acid permease [Rhodanobacteraceae bacterium]
MTFWEQLWTTKPTAANAADNELRPALGPWALTALGVGAIVGTGIFVLTGVAAANNAGPALAVSFVIAGFVCAMAALCYAEFAAMIPVAGSAYSYSYATLGELIAWFIGWNLVLEYLVSISAVAAGWSGYVVSLLKHIGLTIPDAFAKAPLAKGVGAVSVVATGDIINLPAIFIVLAITALCYVGIKHSSTVNIWIVIVKLTVILLFIVFGLHYIVPEHWHPFVPNRICSAAGATGNMCRPGKYGWMGVFEGAAIIFFAYIGFDAVSTAAQEAKNPKRDMPISIIASLVICTALYIVVSLVLTGIVRYTRLNVPDPVAFGIEQVPTLRNWLAPLIDVGALAGLSSVILVVMIGQPRIFYVMSRDGLLPPAFGRVHPRFQTPHVATVITGIVAAIGAGLLPIDILAELTNIGTLLAFLVVCIAVQVLRHTHPELSRPFRVPYPWITCTIGAIGCVVLILSLPHSTWWRAVIWTLIGLVIYFGYGFRHSRLRKGKVQLARPAERWKAKSTRPNDKTGP